MWETEKKQKNIYIKKTSEKSYSIFPTRFRIIVNRHYDKNTQTI
jgi:hypothetical protein